MMDCVTSACREELEHCRMVGVSSFSLPYLLSFDLCRSLWVRRVFHLGAVGAFGGFLVVGTWWIMEAHSAPGKLRICRETRTFSDAYCSAATASRELRRVKRIWSTNRVGGLSSPLLVVVVVVASIVVVSKFVGSPCVFESFTTHSLFVLPHVWCP